MAALKKSVSSFRTAARLLPPPALIVERRAAHPRSNRFMTMERFYKYVLSVGVALAGAAVVVNKELTTAKLEVVKMEVARSAQRVDQLGQQVDQLGQRVDHLRQRVDQLGQRVDHLGQRVDQLGQRVDQLEKKMDEKFELIEKKLDHLLSKQFVTNSRPWSHWPY